MVLLSLSLTRALVRSVASMASVQSLEGRLILVLEDEPILALDIADCFRAAGASVFTAQKLEDGLRLATHPDLSAAVLDFGLSDGESTPLCAALNDRGIPFVLHSGYSDIPAEACANGPAIPKPAAPSELVETVASLLQQTAAFGS
jgi:DNA-binding response OmpR family regulator